MTLKEYKRQIEELSEAMARFDGSEEEALKFLENIGQKYAEVSEFNIHAVECKDLEEFKTLAISYGMEFSSNEEAKELFGQLTEGAKTLTKMVLSEAEMAGISGGIHFWEVNDMKSLEKYKKENVIIGAIAGALVAYLTSPEPDDYMRPLFGALAGELTALLTVIPAGVTLGVKSAYNAFMSKLAQEMIKHGYTQPQQ